MYPDITITFHGKNATLEIMLGLFDIDYYLRDGESVTFEGTRYVDFYVRADEGYHFTGYGTLQHGPQKLDVGVRSGTDNTVARISHNHMIYNSTLTMNAVKIQPEVPRTDVIGFNHIYLVDKDTLSNISLDIFRKRRSYYITDPSGPVDARMDPFVATDPHTYIINTIQLPVKVDPTIIGPEQPIAMGFTKLLPNAPILIEDKLTVDLGTIEVPHTYNNTYDYNNTDILIHLPYINPVIIDPNYAIGETIEIEYIVDVYTGDATINLRSSLVDGKVFHSSNTPIGNVIPFVTIKDATTIGNPRESRTVKHNNTPTPYIEVIRKRPYQIDSIFNRDITTPVNSLHNIKGRIIVHDISLELDTTMQEVATIKSILSNGVTIK